MAQAKSNKLEPSRNNLKFQKNLLSKEAFDLRNNSSIGFFRTTFEGKIIYCNKAFVTMLGYNSIEELKDNILIQDVYKNKNERKRVIKSIIKNGSISNKELTLYRKDGKVIFTKISAKGLFNKKGFLKYIDGFITDISALKKKENKIIKEYNRLRVLNKINSALGSVLEIDELLNKCMEVILSSFSDKIGAVLYLIEDDWLVPEAFYPSDRTDFFFPVKIGSSNIFGNISSEVYFKRKEVVAKNTHNKSFLKRYPQFKNEKEHSFAIFPILFKDECLGIINLFINTVNYFDSEKARFIKDIINHLAIHLHNALEYRKTKQKINEINEKYREINLSYEISLRLSSNLEFDRIINECFSILKEQDFIRANIYLISENNEKLNLLAFYDNENNNSQINEIKKGELFSGLAFSKKEPVIVNDTHSEFALSIAPILKSKKRYSFASFPILFGDRCLGVLSVASNEINSFQKKNLFICEAITKQLAHVLNNALMHSLALQRSNNLEQLYNTVRRLLKHFNITDIFNEAFEIFREMGFIFGKIYRLNEKENVLELFSYFSENKTEIIEKIKVGELFSGKAVKDLVPVIVNDTYSEEALAVDGQLINNIRHSFASFPIEYENKCLGVLNLVGKEVGKFTPEIVNLCVNISRQIALLWNNFLIHEETKVRFEQINLLYEITKRLSSYISLNDIINECFSSFKELGFTDSRIYLYNNEILKLFAYYSESNIINEIPKNISENNLISLESINSGYPIIINNSHGKKMLDYYPDLINYKNFSFATFPIIYGNNKLGVLNLASDRPGSFDDFKMSLIERLAHHLGILLNNSKLYDEIVKKNKELRVLNELSAELNTKMNLEEGCKIISNKLTQIFDFDGFYIDLYNKENDTLSNLINVDTINGKKTSYKGKQNRPITNPFIKNIIVSKEPYLLLRENEEDQVFSLSTFGDTSRRSLSIMYVPIYTGDEVLGIMAVHSYSKYAFNQNDINLLNGIANYIAISIKNIILYNNLRDSQNRYKTLIENAPEAIYSFNNEGLFTAVNKKTCELFNKEEKELLNKPLLSFIDINLRNAFTDSIKLAKETKAPITFDVKTLMDKYYQTTFMPFIEDTNNQVYYVGITRDITLQKKSEEDKIRIQQQISESKKHDFVVNITRNIAHVFNNVLVNVLSRSSFAKTLVDKDSVIYPHLEKIEASSKRVGELIKQLLTFAQSGNYLMEPLDLNKIVQFFFFSNKPKVKENIEFNLILSESKPQVIGNRDQILLVLDKLFTNSIEAIYDKGVITIKTDLVTVEHQLVYSNQRLEVGTYGMFSIIDNGCGIREDIRNRFFEPFNTTKEYGRGLGLPSVYGIIMNHNGFISIQSEMNEGTTVDIYLPIAK